MILANGRGRIAAALQDVGIAYVLQSYAAPFIAGGRLFPLLADFLPALGGGSCAILGKPA